MKRGQAQFPGSHGGIVVQPPPASAARDQPPRACRVCASMERAVATSGKGRNRYQPAKTLRSSASVSPSVQENRGSTRTLVAHRIARPSGQPESSQIFSYPLPFNLFNLFNSFTYFLTVSTCFPRRFCEWKSHSSQSSSGTKRSSLRSHFLGSRVLSFSTKGSKGRFGGNRLSCSSIGISLSHPNRLR